MKNLNIIKVHILRETLTKCDRLVITNTRKKQKVILSLGDYEGVTPIQKAIDYLKTKGLFIVGQSCMSDKKYMYLIESPINHNFGDIL